SLQIGGRNYIQNGLPSNSDLWYFTQQNKSGSSQIKDGYLSITNDNNGWKQWQLYSHKGTVALDKLEADTDYTISFECRRSENSTGSIMFVLRYSVEGGTSNQITISKNVNELGTDWTRLSKTEKISSEILKDYKFLRVIAYFNGNGTVDFRKMNLVQGNKAPRDWTPAPEDTNEAINNVSGRVESLNGEIETLAGQVKLKANQTIVDSLDKRVEIAEGELKVLPGEINAKVSKDDLYAEINLNPKKAKIEAKNIELKGAVTVLSDIAGNLGNITAGTISGTKLLSEKTLSSGPRRKIEINDSVLKVHEYSPDGTLTRGMTAQAGSIE